jgi:dTDP-4-dehydrorhamnose reductase
MKILITGANGQIGRALAQSAPPDVEVVSCTKSDLDVTDRTLVAAYLRQVSADVVINTAAYTAVDRAESEPHLARLTNTAAAEYLALAVRGTGARLIHLSTDFVFGGNSSTPYRPSSPTGPLNVYGLTKRDGEAAVMEALPDRSVVLRTAWIYAAQGKNFVATMLRIMRSNGAVNVVTDQIGTPTSARSVADAIWKILDQPSLTGIHHWTDNGVASWYDFAVAIAEEGAQLRLVSPQVTVTPITTREYPTAALRPKYAVLDTSSLGALRNLAIHWRMRLRGVLREMKDG